MTINTTIRTAGPFAGGTGMRALPFMFKVLKPVDLLVTKLEIATNVETIMVLDTDYTVALNADQEHYPGGNVVLSVELPAGFKVTITSNMENLQLTSIQKSDGFYPRIIEDTFDRQTICIQQLNEILKRCFKLSVSNTGTSATFPSAEGNKLLAWKPDGSGLQNVRQEDVASSIIPTAEASNLLGWTSTGIGIRNYNRDDLHRLLLPTPEARHLLGFGPDLQLRLYDMEELSDDINYATARCSKFVGDGVTTRYTLTANPVSINNVFVSVGGLAQTPQLHWYLEGMEVIFVNPPPFGQNIIIQHMLSLPLSEVDWDHIFEKPFMETPVDVMTETTFSAPVVILPGAKYMLGAGVTATFTGPFYSLGDQCFYGTGFVRGLTDLRPEMFGENTIPGTTNMTAAIKAALQCLLYTRAGVLRVKCKQYAITERLVIPPNVRVIGEGAGMLPNNPNSAQQPNGGIRGPSFIWKGILTPGNTEYMVAITEATNVVWDGVSLVGDWDDTNQTDIRGFLISGGATYNAHNIHISNTSLYKLKYGLKITDSTATDNHNIVVEKFGIHSCNIAAEIECASLGATFRDGVIDTIDMGLSLKKSQVVDISNVSFTDSTGSAGNHISVENLNSSVSISGCIARTESGATQPKFIELHGGTNPNPVVLQNNIAGCPIEIGSTQRNLTMIGNKFSADINVNANECNITSINDRYDPGCRIRDNGAATQISYSGFNPSGNIWVGDGAGTWTPRLFCGTNEVTALDTAIGTYTTKGDICFFRIRVNKTSGATSFASARWEIQGFPFSSDLTQPNLSDGGAVNVWIVNGVDYAKAETTLWRMTGGTSKISIFGPHDSTQWTTGSVGAIISGYYHLTQVTLT